MIRASQVPTIIGDQPQTNPLTNPSTPFACDSDESDLMIFLIFPVPIGGLFSFLAFLIESAFQPSPFLKI
jgi:hypothetical protein